MLDELYKLILFIQQQYNNLYEEWKNKNSYKLINQKNTLVKNINEDGNVLSMILNYRAFINEKSFDLKKSFDNLNSKSEINTRVKAQNSIEYKIQNYMLEKHEYGMIPLNKCLNDLYGIRIIFKDNVDYNSIKMFIKEKFNDKLKCYDASKDDYRATHIYFKADNYSFQWELQVWNKENEKTNIVSHEKYKQDYTKWEKGNKGGVSL